MNLIVGIFFAFQAKNMKLDTMVKCIYVHHTTKFGVKKKVESEINYEYLKTCQFKL